MRGLFLVFFALCSSVVCAASGSITWDTGTPRYPNSCVIYEGANRCTVEFSWTSVGAPGATLWYYNLDLGTSGPVSQRPSAVDAPISWISTERRVFKLHASNSSTSSVLAQTPVITGIRYRSIVPTVLKGGANYGWWALGTSTDSCARGDYGVIKQYNSGVIPSQLAVMRNEGMQTLRLPVFFSRQVNPGGTVMGLVPLSTRSGGVGLSVAHLENFRSLVEDIKVAGFRQVVVGLFPQGQSSAYGCGSSCVSPDILASEAISLLKQLVPVLRSSSLPFFLDLGNEHIALDQGAANYSKALWKKFRADPFFAAERDYAYFSTIASSIWSVENRVPRMTYIYGSDFPAIHQFHIYASGSSADSNLEAAILKRIQEVLDSNSIPRGAWIIGETFYNDATTADNLKKGIIAIDQDVLAVIEWPQLRQPACSNVSVAPPTAFGQYKQHGF